MEVASSEAKINDCKGENILKVRGCSRLSLLLLRSVALALALPPRKRLHYVKHAPSTTICQETAARSVLQGRPVSSVGVHAASG